MELIKRVGKRLIEGKDVVSVSLPVRIFEPRSTIERICDVWAFMPIYLRLAANTKVLLLLISPIMHLNLFFRML